MVTLLKMLTMPWEKARGYLQLDLDRIAAAINQRWNATFTSTNTLQATAIAGDATPATRYVANTGTDNAPTWDRVNLSNGVTGVLPATLGGTGLTSYAVGDLVFASTTTVLTRLADVAAGAYLRSGGVAAAPVWSSVTLPNAATIGDIWFASTTAIMTALADVATGNALLSGGIGVAPAYGKIGLTTHVSGILPVANGGTGVATTPTKTFFAGPASGADAAPTFRTIAVADVPTLNQDTTGLAAKATILATTRAINGVNFDGSAPITVPMNNANDATNADYFVVFTSTQAGNFAALTSTGLKFHPSTGILTATGFAGPLVGNVTGNASGSAGTVTSISSHASTELSDTALLARLASPTFTGIVTTAGQIKFPATQNPSANANTLDDYEEGTWTPAITFATPGDVAVTYTLQVGTYVKIGNLVRVNCNILTATFTHTTAAGDFQITGLPFTSQNLASSVAIGGTGINGFTVPAGFTSFMARIAPNGSIVTLLRSGSASANTTFLFTDHTTTVNAQATFTIVYATET